MITTSLCKNLNSILLKADVKHKCKTEDIAKKAFSIDIPLKDVTHETIEKLIKVAQKYKEYKTHTTEKHILRLIFDTAKNEKKDNMIKDFATFVNEKYGNEEGYGNGNSYIRNDRSETKTQKIIYPTNEYEIGERVQVSIYSENKKFAGAMGHIVVPDKVSEGKVCIEFRDGKKDYFLTTEINRI